MMFLASPGLASAQGMPIVQAGRGAGVSSVIGDVAVAARVRLQSQRIAKLYWQAGLQVDEPRALRQLDAAFGEVDGELGRLGRRVRQPAAQRVLSRCATLWGELRALARQPAAPATLERVNLLADELMLQAGKLAFLIEAEAETPVGRLLDLSSRLNMLAQRLARLYLQAHAGDRSQGVLTDIEQARKEFAAGLRELENAPENRQSSREAIALARNQWIFFEAAISRLNAARTEPSAAGHVATSSERIAEVLDLVTAQYARDSAEGDRGRN